MGNIKFRYTCKRDNGHTFSQVFSLEQIEAGDAKRWIETNYIDLVPLIRDRYTGLKDGTKWAQLTEEEQQKWTAIGGTKETWYGKEIYEGDVARVICGCGYSENLTIKWADGRNGYYLEAYHQHDWDNNQLSMNWPSRLRIIGNIHSGVTKGGNNE